MLYKIEEYQFRYRENAIGQQLDSVALSMNQYVGA